MDKNSKITGEQLRRRGPFGKLRMTLLDAECSMLDLVRVDFRGNEEKLDFFKRGFAGQGGDFIGHCATLRNRFACGSYILWYRVRRGDYVVVRIIGRCE